MDYTNLPSDLPIPEDAGECDHVLGMAMPKLLLDLTSGTQLDLSALKSCVLYIYPMTAQPGIDLPDSWDTIPGARGCTPQSCSFRDHYKELKALGYEVYGLSSQASSYQKEAKDRLHLPFDLISDVDCSLSDSLSLPTFRVDEYHLYRRLTLIIHDGVIVKTFYPVFPPDRNADEVITWIHDAQSTCS